MNQSTNRMRSNVLILACCQALTMSGSSLIILTASLVGAILAPHPQWATLPVACMFTGTLIATFPAAMLMNRIGRRAGFYVGLMIGVIGAIIVTTGITTGVIDGGFFYFCIGSLLIGVVNAFGQYYRFAAADVATPEYRSRAISWVLAGGIVAAFIGPGIAIWTWDMVATVPYAGSYSMLVGLYAISMLFLFFARLPMPTIEERSGATRPLSQIIRQPEFFVAVIGATVAYGSMNLIMVSTPVEMKGCGYLLPDSASVIMWHILAMFAPSFVTGHLIRYFGVTRIMVTGTLLLAVCVTINLNGSSLIHFTSALIALGLGWNFLFVGGTTLLTDAYRPAEKAKTQGFNDLIIFSTVALTAVTSGLLHHHFGWETINLAVIPAIVVAFAATLWLDRRRRRLMQHRTV